MDIIKKGATITFRDPFNMEVKCEIAEKMYTKNSKKYVELDLHQTNVKKIQEIHKYLDKYMTKKNVINPLEGSQLKVKVPFLKNRVICKISGDKTLQEYKKGDSFEGVITFCGVWSVGEYCGPSWKIVSVQ